MHGSILDYFIVFGSGVLTSFTPCVYPVIPLIVSFIGGANTKGTKTRAFAISFIYVTGIAVTYCFLAVFAALTGHLFGNTQNSPVTFVVVGNVLILFALMMFDVIPLHLGHGNSGVKLKPKNLWSVLLIGMSSALVIGPCTAPIAGSLLLYIGSKQNILHGISLMLVFSYGLGSSLILIGTFSGSLAALPKSGRWMNGIKKFCGLVLLLAAEYYLIKAGTLYF